MKFALVSVAPEKFALVRFWPARFTPVRLLPDKPIPRQIVGLVAGRRVELRRRDACPSVS